MGSRGAFRILQFSAQRDHLHLIVEAEDRRALSRGLQGLAIRLAKAVNRSLSRHGRVWGGRYHVRALKTPREVRNALVYVLQNWRKHIPGIRGLDPCSSAVWFSGWKRTAPEEAARSPVVAARTWLAAVGWRRPGLIDENAAPVSLASSKARQRKGRRGHLAWSAVVAVLAGWRGRGLCLRFGSAPGGVQSPRPSGRRRLTGAATSPPPPHDPSGGAARAACAAGALGRHHFRHPQFADVDQTLRWGGVSRPRVAEAGDGVAAPVRRRRLARAR